MICPRTEYYQKHRYMHQKQPEKSGYTSVEQEIFSIFFLIENVVFVKSVVAENVKSWALTNVVSGPTQFDDYRNYF